MAAPRPMTGQRGMGPPPTTGMGRGPVAAVPGKNFLAPTSSSSNAPPGMRPPTNAGRPGSSAGGAVPQGMRPPTSGGLNALNGPGVALQTNVQVENRPVTGMASGLRGMPTAPMGPNRVIADKTYYLTELNKKLNDIMRAIENMQNEIQKTAEDNQLFSQLERKYDSHMKEVRVKEGQLADFNLAFDKLRTNTNIGEIQELYNHMKQRNEHEKRAVDEVFLKVQHQEKQTRDIEDRIANLHQAAANRIAALGEEKEHEYLDLKDELLLINERAQEREGALQHFEREIGAYEDTMKSEAYQIYQKGVSLNKENQMLQKQKQELEDELNSQLSPAEIKEKLTQKIKDGTTESNELEAKIKKLELNIEKLSDQVRAKENELTDAKKHTTKAKKYEQIYERDAKMQEFISSFPQTKQEELEKKRKLKETIVALLQHISKGLNNSANLSSGGSNGDGSGPDSEKFQELKSELTFKEEKMADSKKTLELLQGELAKRREELEKVEQLDAKIGGEIQQLQGDMKRMNKEMAEFKTEDELKAFSVQAKKDLLTENSRAKKVRDAIKIQVGLLSAETERKTKEINSNEIMKRIENWESKLKTHAGAVFTLQEYIHTRKRESDYEGLLKECSDVTKQINSLLTSHK